MPVSPWSGQPQGPPLRPLAVTELLDAAVRSARRNWRAALALAVPFAVVRAFGDAWLRYAAATSTADVTTAVLLGQIAISCLIGTMLAGVLAPLFAAEAFGPAIGAAETARRARRPALFVLALVVTAGQTVGVALAGVGGVWLWGVWAVAAPALVLERVGPWAALSRSFLLVRTQFWRTWGTRALRWLVTIVLGTLLTLPFTALAAYLGDADLFTVRGVSDPGVFVAVTAVGQLVELSIITPISAAVDTLLYLDLRMRREGMDIPLALPREATGVTA